MKEKKTFREEKKLSFTLLIHLIFGRLINKSNRDPEKISKNVIMKCYID